MSVTIKREVILRSIVTDQLKEQLAAELQRAADEVAQNIQQIDFNTKAYISDLQRMDLQQAMSVRKRVEAEKKRQQELHDALMERKQQVEVLDNDTEVIRGTIESFVEVDEGDDLSIFLGGTEIVTKDDIIVEIRQRQPLDGEDAALTIDTDLSNAKP